MVEPADGTRRDGSPWVVAVVVAVAVAVGLVADPRAGAYVLAAALAAGAAVRAVRPGPPPVALGGRSRWLDVALLTGQATALAVLAAVVPM